MTARLHIPAGREGKERKESTMEELTITTENFDALVARADKPVLLDFWASWCGPCRMLAPTVAELAREADSYLVGKVNVDEQPELARRFSIMSIPTLVVTEAGREVRRIVGVVPKARILALLGK